MGVIVDQFGAAFRDFVLDGVASSGAHDVVKAQVRAIGPLIETAIANAGLGSLVDVIKDTKSALDGDLAHAADTVALVYADATEENNDLYVKVGASGSGSWTNTGALNGIISSLAQPFVDAAEASAESLAGVTDDVEIGLGTGASAVRLLEASGSITPSCFRTFQPTTSESYDLVAIARREGAARFLNLINSVVAINVTFDLEAGTFILGPTGNNATATMRELGGGFYECVATIVSPNNTNSAWQARPSPGGSFPFTGDTARGIWLKSLVLRVTGSTTNLFPSSDPANAAFTKNSLTATPGTAPEQRTSERVAALEASTFGLEQSVNGTMTATRMTEASGSSLSVRAFRSVSIPNGDSFRLEFQAKAGERRIVRSFSQGGIAHTASFNLETGVASGVGASMERLFNGFWNCVYEAVSSDSSSQNWQVQIANDVGGWPYDGNGSSGVFLHRARATNLTTDQILYEGIDWSAGWTLTSATITPNAALFGGITADDLGEIELHPLFGRRVVVLGTSLVAQNQWTAAFQSLTGCLLTNLGESGGSYGLSSDYADPRIGECSARLTTSDIPADTALIIADMGVNDPLWRVPLGAVTDTTTATFAGAMANVSIWAAANRPDAQVLFTQLTSAEPSYPTHRHGGTASGGQPVVAELEEYQLMLERIARREGRALIDLNDAGISWRTAGIRGDGLHWNTTGGALIGQILEKETRRLAVPGWLS